MKNYLAPFAAAAIACATPHHVPKETFVPPSLPQVVRILDEVCGPFAGEPVGKDPTKWLLAHTSITPEISACIDSTIKAALPLHLGHCIARPHAPDAVADQVRIILECGYQD